MSKLLRVGSSVVFAVIAIWAASVQAEEAGEISWHTNAEQAWEAMREQGRPLLLFITTDGCRFCTHMKSSTYADDKVRSEVGGKFVALRLNADHDVEEAWLERFGIEYFPTTLLIAPNLKVIDRIDGYVDAEKMHPRLLDVARRSEGIRMAQAAKPKSSPME